MEIIGICPGSWLFFVIQFVTRTKFSCLLFIVSAEICVARAMKIISYFG